MAEVEGATMLSIRELRDRAVIRPIKRAVEDQLLDLPGVTGVDIGSRTRAGSRLREQVIVVSVARKRPREVLGRDGCVPAELFGIPTDVVEEQAVLQHIHRSWEEPLWWPARTIGSDDGGPGCPLRAVRGGSGLAPCRSVRLEDGEFHRIGTLGVLVAGDAEPMGLTTFDVGCLDDAWSVGDRMAEPESGRVHAELARAALSGRVDAAAVRVVPGLTASPEVGRLGPVTGHARAYPGEPVRKHGFGTGLTDGVVTSVDATIRVDHGAALGVRVLREQIRITTDRPHFCGPGDAGAAVVDPSGRLLGLHVAGADGGAIGYATPIGDVLSELDVRLHPRFQPLGV
ncbi:S1 family peptidase [Saccharopolyspora flava]|nr:S1 family peptidase [Saccharopolyspora flava]